MSRLYFINYIKTPYLSNIILIILGVIICYMRCCNAESGEQLIGSGTVVGGHGDVRAWSNVGVGLWGKRKRALGDGSKKQYFEEARYLSKRPEDSWNKLNSLWGKRSSWQTANGLWGKRSLPPISSNYQNRIRFDSSIPQHYSPVSTVFTWPFYRSNPTNN